MSMIRIPPVLRQEAGGERRVEATGDTVRAVLTDLVARHPALGARVFAGDQLPTFLNVFVDGDDIRLHQGLDTPVGEASTVVLLPAVAGGSEVDESRIRLYACPMPRPETSKPFAFSMILACAQSG